MTISPNSVPEKLHAVTRDALPVHFFTIVLNGEPFIRYHIEVFRRLRFEWHWHIVEGVADLKHDTAWSVANGGRITEDLHRNGLSNDGTSEYLNELAQLFPNRVTVYRKPVGEFWDGKLEMVSAPLAALDKECLLWQVDADELWTAEQISRVRALFLAQSDRTAAYFFCHYFVGENLMLTKRGAYGNNPACEWLRCWRFTPGCRWLSHEPPRLFRQTGGGSWVDLAALAPLRHAQTEAHALRFQHFAYVTREQLRFKEIYYGYTDAVIRWESLQAVPCFPVRLKSYLPWSCEDAIVDTARSRSVSPLARKDPSGRWHFSYDDQQGYGPRSSRAGIALARCCFEVFYLTIHLRERLKRMLARIRRS